MHSKGVLYLVSCASSDADRVPDFVKLAQKAGWDVCVSRLLCATSAYPERSYELA